MKRMKTLILTNHSYMLWQFRRELIEKLAEDGEVVISMPFVGHEKDFQKNYKCIKTEIDRRGINPIKDLKLYSFYKRLILTEKPDRVVTYSIKPNIYGGCVCKKFAVPYFVNVQGLGTAFQKEPIASIVTLMYKLALKSARAVFFENQKNADEFQQRKIVSKEQIIVLNGAGVNLEQYCYQPYPDESEGIHFLYIGRIMREKGLNELIAVIRKLKPKYGDRIKFDLVGFFEDEYKESIAQLEKDGYIRFHGFQTDPKPYYGIAHCVVLPSYHEGMSNVLLEASSIGRALITSDIPGCREAVADGVNGFLCKAQDAQSLEDAVEKFLHLTQTERAEMGKRGRLKMHSEFDKKDIVRKTVEILEK